MSGLEGVSEAVLARPLILAAPWLPSPTFPASAGTPRRCAGVQTAREGLGHCCRVFRLPARALVALLRNSTV